MPHTLAPGIPTEVATDICVVIPAYNEARTIASVVREVSQAVPGAGIVVVNDGSTDETAQAAEAAGATVLSLPLNLGIGGAVQAGYRFADNHGYQIAVQVDGDGQHDPYEVGRIVEPLAAQRADMVVGSRWLGRGDYTAAKNRRIGMRLLSALVSLRGGQRFTDTTSGFRAVGPRALRLFAGEYPSDFPEVETLIVAVRHGLRVTEVPVSMRPRSEGRSSIAGVRSAYYMARVSLSVLVGNHQASVTP
jgi:glycosyltransferase involved in cell wall biosynthesis